MTYNDEKFFQNLWEAEDKLTSATETCKRYDDMLRWGKVFLMLSLIAGIASVPLMAGFGIYFLFLPILAPILLIAGLSLVIYPNRRSSRSLSDREKSLVEVARSKERDAKRRYDRAASDILDV